jgi:hypothetical protein
MESHVRHSTRRFADDQVRMAENQPKKRKSSLCGFDSNRLPTRCLSCFVSKLAKPDSNFGNHLPPAWKAS